MHCTLNLAQGPSYSGTSWPQQHDLRAAGSNLSWSPQLFDAFCCWTNTRALKVRGTVVMLLPSTHIWEFSALQSLSLLIQIFGEVRKKEK